MENQFIFHNEVRPTQAVLVSIHKSLIHPTILEGFIKRNCNTEHIFVTYTSLYCQHARPIERNQHVLSPIMYCQCKLVDY